MGRTVKGFLPQCLMACFSLLSMRNTGIPTRPNSTITMGGVPIKALFDTGSTVTLCHAKFLPNVRSSSNSCYMYLPELRSANGSALKVIESKYVSIQLKAGEKRLHQVYFVKNLQVDAIIGMDFMAKNKITIDTSSKKIHIPPWKLPAPEPRIPFRTNPYTTQTLHDKDSEYEVMVVSEQAFSIAPNEEQKVTFKIPSQPTICPSRGLFSSDESYHDELIFLDGVINPQQDICSTVVLNKSNRSIHLPKNSPLGTVSTNPSTQFAEYHEVFSVQHGKPVLKDTSHIEKVDLSHVPPNYIASYKSLLIKYADVFSRHDLDVGHSKTLPHQVRLTDPNRVVSINQYRLPYHLKEVAIDYVDKLLRSGVVRPSTSVFNSP